MEHDRDVFHCACRDAYVAHATDADEGRGPLVELFRRVVALEDRAEADRQIDAGVLERVRLIDF